MHVASPILVTPFISGIETLFIALGSKPLTKALKSSNSKILCVSLIPPSTTIPVPVFDFIAVVRDQVWTANIDEGSGRVPFRTRWSAINNSTSWTVGTDQADFQDIPDAGAITGLVGGEYATILLEKAIARASYVGSPLIYQIDRVETSRGCP